MPEDELPELTVEKIQNLLRKLDSERGTISNPPGAAREVTLENEGPAPVDTEGVNETIKAGEHPMLQEELGCMLLDSMGKYRMLLIAAYTDLRLPSY